MSGEGERGRKDGSMMIYALLLLYYIAAGKIGDQRFEYTPDTSKGPKGCR